MKPHPTRTPQTPDARRRAAMADENRRMSDAALRAAERARRGPQEARGPRLPSMDVELAVLYVARLLEAKGRPQEAAVLKLQLGEMLIRAALHKVEHQGPIALGHAMYVALRLNRGVRRGVRSKKSKGPDR